MAEHTWTYGDGLHISINIADCHTIDRTGIHNTAFCPGAAEDPGTGIQIRADGKIAIGHQSGTATMFSRAQARVKLLHRLLDGVELSDPKGENIYRAVGTTKGKRNGTIIVRLSDLFWRTGSSDQWAEFPSLLEDRYDLPRPIAWRLAWALVRAAYAQEWDTVNLLIERASARAAAASEKNATKAPAMDVFAPVLEFVVSKLKERRLP